MKKARAEQLDVVKGYAREYVNDAHTWEIPFAGGLNKSIVNSLEASNPLFVTFY